MRPCRSERAGHARRWSPVKTAAEALEANTRVTASAKVRYDQRGEVTAACNCGTGCAQPVSFRAVVTQMSSVTARTAGQPVRPAPRFRGQRRRASAE